MNYDYIFIYYGALTNQDLERYGIDFLYSKSKKILILNVKKIIDPLNYDHKLNLCSAPNKKKFSYSDLSSLKSFKDECEKIKKKNTKIFCILGVQFDEKISEIYDTLNKLSLNYIDIVYLARRTKNLTRLKIISYFFIKLISYFLKLEKDFSRKPMQFIMSSESNLYSYLRHSKRINPLKFQLTHSFDYENFFFKRDKTSSPIPFDNYCVFVDENIIENQDWLYSQKILDSFLAIKKVYREKLLKFFLKLEKELRVKVVISCHPKADFSFMQNFYQPHKIVKRNSISLIENSKFCITHASLAVDLWVLANKPVNFITLEELEPLYGRSIKISANCISREVFKIDKNFDLNLLMKNLNPKKRNQYVSLYIKSPLSLNASFNKIYRNF